MYTRIIKLQILLIVFLAAFGSVSAPVQAQILNMNDETYLILALKKEKARFSEISDRWRRRQSEFQDGLIAREEYNRTRQEYDIALINYQQAMLRVIFDQPYIIVEEAVKYQAGNSDRKQVRLKITNTTGGSLDYQRLLEQEGEIFTEDLVPDRINNVFVSLINIADNTIISKPYEMKIPYILFGESKTINFELLRDVESIRISMTYVNNTTFKDVYLEKDAAANIVEITSSQYSQEAELGTNTTFDLQLERFSSEDNIYFLEVVNLPRQISYNFTETGSSSRLSSVKFTEGITNKNLQLRLFMPERDDTEVVIDEPLSFYVLAISEDKREQIAAMTSKILTDNEIAGLELGAEKLELIPRGVGEMEIVLSSLYFPIETGEVLSIKARIKNTGTRRLNNISLETDSPLNWTVSVQPDLVRELDVGKEQEFELLVQTSSNAGVGDMIVTLRAEAMADNRRVETNDRDIRIHVEGAANIAGTLILVGVFAFVIVGFIIVGIKLSRR